MDPPDTLSVGPPTEPEELYHPRGDEAMPDIRSGPSHTVFHNHPGDEQYFVRSKLNGRRALANAIKPPADSLHFALDFRKILKFEQNSY